MVTQHPGADGSYSGAMPVLDGLKVIDISRVLAAPFCTMLLGAAQSSFLTA